MFKDCLLLLVLKLICDFFLLELIIEELIFIGLSCYLVILFFNFIVLFFIVYMIDIVVYVVYIVISG